MQTLNNGSLCRKIALHVMILVAVNALAWVVRAIGDDAGAYLKPYMATYYPDQVAYLSRVAWWHLLLPLNDFGGRWGPTGFLLVHFVESWIGEPRAYYLLNAVMITTGYALSYLTFRSFRLSFLFALGLAASTFNYHVYAVSGSVIMLPLITFMFAYGYAQMRFLAADGVAIGWFAAAASACIVMALSYEGWLDIVPFAWITMTILGWRFHAVGDLSRRNRAAVSVLMVTVAAVAYVVIKSAFGLEGLHPKGGEADLIATYGSHYRILAAEDVVSSFFTFFYTSLSTYFPPWFFSFSESLARYGPDKVVALQEGYHPQGSHLVLYNHLFLWRYYAGFAVALFGLWYWRSIKDLWQSLNAHHITVFVLLTSIFVGSPTHLIIKWRPMHAAPFLGYQVYLSTMGLTLLLAYLVARAPIRWGQVWGTALAILLAVDFVYCAYSRPALLSIMSQQSFLGTYPDPRVNLKMWMHSKEVPAN